MGKDKKSKKVIGLSSLQVLVAVVLSGMVSFFFLSLLLDYDLDESPIFFVFFWFFISLILILYFGKFLTGSLRQKSTLKKLGSNLLQLILWIVTISLAFYGPYLIRGVLQIAIPVFAIFALLKIKDGDQMENGQKKSNTKESVKSSWTSTVHGDVVFIIGMAIFGFGLLTPFASLNFDGTLVLGGIIGLPILVVGWIFMVVGNWFSSISSLGIRDLCKMLILALFLLAFIMLLGAYLGT